MKTPIVLTVLVLMALPGAALAGDLEPVIAEPRQFEAPAGFGEGWFLRGKIDVENNRQSHPFSIINRTNGISALDAFLKLDLPGNTELLAYETAQN